MKQYRSSRDIAAPMITSVSMSKLQRVAIRRTFASVSYVDSVRSAYVRPPALVPAVHAGVPPPAARGMSVYIRSVTRVKSSPTRVKSSSTRVTRVKSSPTRVKSSPTRVKSSEVDCTNENENGHCESASELELNQLSNIERPPRNGYVTPPRSPRCQLSSDSALGGAD
jgi:hypothetical protein